MIDPAIANIEKVQAATSIVPRIAIVLGSGLGAFAESVQSATRISYSELQAFPAPGVSGHAGELIVGKIADTGVAVLSGRAHYYEHGAADVMRIPLETLARLGVETLFLTNSAGSLRQEVPPGSVMRISDHINFSGTNPLLGEASDKRFVGMTNAYDSEWAAAASRAALSEGVELHEGVYMWFSGPSFETPAEIRAAQSLGADAVGMSTVPEVILARFLNLRVAAFSVITNLGAGMTGTELSHQETKDMAPIGGGRLGRILTRMISDEG